MTDPNPLFEIVNINTITPVPCPCGSTRRAFTEDPDKTASLHVVDVTAEAKTHYHKVMTEIYYVLEGNGEIELDGTRYPLSEGMSVLIKPGCRHRAIGDMKILNVPIPAFDPADEYFD